MNRRKAWATAFAKQAEADMNTFFFWIATRKFRSVSPSISFKGLVKNYAKPIYAV